MIAAEERTVRVDGIRLHVLQWGARDRPAVVLLHGGSAHARWWDFVVPHLADRYRVIVPDLRGHGDSGHASPPAYAIDNYANDLRELAAALDVERFALVGHSLGAFVALRFTARHPDAVRSLAIVDGRPHLGRGRRASLVTRLQHLPHPRFGDEDEAVRRFRLLPSGTSARPDVLRHVALAGLRRLDDGTFTLKFDRAAFAGYTGIDVSDAITGLRCPTLFVRGGSSTYLDAATFAHMAALSPRAETAEISDAQHHVKLDQPDLLAARLLTFLERSPP